MQGSGYSGNLPVIPIQVEYDMMMEGQHGYWDFWVGYDPCSHHEIYVERR